MTAEADAGMKRILCPYCSYACELGVTIDDFGIGRVEYLPDTPNRGRICPRGSAIALLLNHPRRLVRPMKGNGYITWDRARAAVDKATADPDATAVFFDRNLTREEHGALIAFCARHGIENCASAYFEPEAQFESLVDDTKPFDPGRIADRRAILIAGDIFNQSPMVSREIIEWRLKDRGHRLIVVDSRRSHTAAFATDFIKVAPGTEPLALLGMCRPQLVGRKLIEGAEADPDLIAVAARMLRDSGAGLILAATSFGRYYDDRLLAKALELLAEHAGAEVVPFFEAAGYPGRKSFASVLALVRAKKIKNALCFGELFPVHYPQFGRDLKGVNVILAASLRCDCHTALPAALLVEKTGTIPTTFGRKKLSGAIDPASGAKTMFDIAVIPAGEGAPLYGAKALSEADVKTRMHALVERRAGSIPGTKRKHKNNRNLRRLIGAKSAYQFLGLYEAEAVEMNPRDAAGLRISPEDLVNVESRHGRQTLPVRFSAGIDPGTVAVPAETGKTRGLFDYDVQGDEIMFMPTEVELWRKE